MSGWAQSLANSGSSKLDIKDKRKCLIIRSRTPRGITWAPGSHCFPRPPLGSGVRAVHFSPQIMNSLWIAVHRECRSTQEVPPAAIPIFSFCTCSSWSGSRSEFSAAPNVDWASFLWMPHRPVVVIGPRHSPPPSHHASTMQCMLLCPRVWDKLYLRCRGLK